MLSLLSSPTLLMPGSAAASAARGRACSVRAAASASDSLRPGASLAPAAGLAESSFLTLPMRSLIIEATSLASAYSRRMTSTMISGAVSTSSTSMILSKKAMFSGRVMMISRLVRSSATICTLPRITPRSASATSVSMIVLASGSGVAVRAGGRMTPGTGGGAGRLRRWMPGAPETLASGALLACCWAFCDSAMISSRRFLMSAALAWMMGRMLVSSRLISGWSMYLRISIMRLTLSTVSVMRMLLVRSKIWICPSLRLKPSMALRASSSEMLLRTTIWLTILPSSVCCPAAGSSNSVLAPCLRMSLAGSTFMNFSPTGCRAIPFMTRAVSMAWRYSSSVSSDWLRSVMVALGTSGAISSVRPVTSA